MKSPAMECASPSGQFSVVELTGEAQPKQRREVSMQGGVPHQHGPADRGNIEAVESQGMVARSTIRILWPRLPPEFVDDRLVVHPMSVAQWC